VHEFAITVIGHDRPGIIADTSEVLAGLGLNLTDSTMTLLRGHFAMTLICAGEPAAPWAESGTPTPAQRADQIEAALRTLTEGGALVTSVREVGPEPDEPATGGHFVLSLHGADRLGIVAAVTRVLAAAGGNVTDLTTRLVGDLYVLVAEVDLPSTVDLAGLTAQLREAGEGLGVEAHLRPADADVL
jgi:glycine cleavage system transcriptional repressor